jgi:hypothetical protein
MRQSNGCFQVEGDGDRRAEGLPSGCMGGLPRIPSEDDGTWDYRWTDGRSPYASTRAVPQSRHPAATRRDRRGSLVAPTSWPSRFVRQPLPPQAPQRLQSTPDGRPSRGKRSARCQTASRRQELEGSCDNSREADAVPSPEQISNAAALGGGAHLDTAPFWKGFGASMSSSPWEWLWNGDEDVATPFHAGEVSRCAHGGISGMRGHRGSVRRRWVPSSPPAPTGDSQIGDTALAPSRLRVFACETPLPRWSTHFIRNKAVEATNGTDHTNKQGLGSRSPRTCEVRAGPGWKPPFQRGPFVGFVEFVVKPTADSRLIGPCRICRPAGAGDPSKPSPCGWMSKNDSRRDAETQRNWVFQSSSSSHHTVIPFTVAQASDFLSLSASLPLCARFLLHGYR